MKMLVSFFAVLLLACSITAQPATPKPSATPLPTPQPFLMAVEDAFYITGRGVVVTGKIERGTAKLGDTVEVVGINPTKTATISGIQMFRKMLEEAKSGENVGILLRGIERADIERGQVLAKPGTVKSYTKITATIDLLDALDGGRKTPFADKYYGQFFFRTSNFSGTLTLPKGVTSVAPGTKGTVVEITFTKPVPIEKGQIFGIYETTRPIGQGTVITLVQ